jgi:hypothetical protein
LKKKDPQLNSVQRSEHVELVIESGLHRSRENTVKDKGSWCEILDKNTSRLGVVCLSEKPDDILMWSHYADKHMGVCLAYDFDILKRMFYSGKVKYKKKYPQFNAFTKGELNDIWNTFVLTKSKHWKYEKEHRLVIDINDNSAPTKNNRVVKYPEDALIGVIWGCQVDVDKKQDVLDAIQEKRNSIKIFNAAKSDHSYSINIESA